MKIVLIVVFSITFVVTNAQNIYFKTDRASRLTLATYPNSKVVSYTYDKDGNRISRVTTVNALPSAGTISGPTSVCVGATITLTETVTGGVWSSSNPAVATIGSSSGIVAGISVGTAIITYAVTNAVGTSTTTWSITVNGPPSAGTISGSFTVCEGSTTTLTNPVPGGVWTSTSSSIATVSSTGVVTGISVGPVFIDYTVTNSCGSAMTNFPMTVLPISSCGGTLGRNDPSTVSDIRVYPNPTNDLFTIETTGTETLLGVHVMDVNGKTIRNIVIKEKNVKKIPIDASKIIPGIYTIQIQTDKREFVAKIVIL